MIHSNHSYHFINIIRYGHVSIVTLLIRLHFLSNKINFINLKYRKKVHCLLALYLFMYDTVSLKFIIVRLYYMNK